MALASNYISRVNNKWIEDDMGNTIMIEGVGKNAEIVINEKGGRQSKSPMAMHLVDPYFLHLWAKDGQELLEYTDSNGCKCVDNTKHYDMYTAILNIASFMIEGNNDYLNTAMMDLEEDNIKQLTRIAKVLQYGAERYEANNWRLIPQEEHINHALIHIIAELSGDTQDDHIDHALCRLMMTFATTQSEGFSYKKYISKQEKEMESFYERL